MPFTLDVSLISGKTVSLETHDDESLESLRLRAQRALGAGKGRLFTSAGSALDGETPLKRARLQNAEPLMFQVGRVATQATCQAFATILGMVPS